MMKRALYLAFMFAGTIGVVASFLVLMIFLEVGWLSDHVYPIGMKVRDWLDNFKLWATVGIVGAGIVSLLWYTLSAFVFKFNHWRSNYLIWWILMFFPAVLPLTVLAYLFTKQTNGGSGWAYFFYVTNSFLVYYLSTLLFSPSSVMYTPVGAKYVRRW
jgi:hypothetical protein